ncbi:uncharacterized protein LOC111334137 [Stylophora pistillata]|uniref:Endonuclease/exonuclease/phosphatase domain-containing protein n=1 Tax=Stylophora pistillata TaxID=50429 RepID=A0A2B4S0F3_STYPI|nr:uncharacterized protein LOC111334137 [Stylophora pistillata]PFX22523.1 hypothetical protein AWC38_SpisGene12962 [Stylophora pistillata]
MEDPTIFVGLSSEAINRILAGDNREQIANDLKKSIPEGRLKASQNPSSFVMTINMNGPTKGKGTAEKRRDLLSIILNSGFPPDIIFCQEIPGKFEAEVIPEGYDFVVNEKEAAVIWNSQHFDGSSDGLKTTDTEITRLMERVEGKDSSANGLLSRISMVRLTPKQNAEADILAVSYHAPYKIEQKHNVCQILLSFLDAVLKQKAISSYIVGGDFNFDTRDFEPPKDVTVPSYEMTPRSQEKQEESSKFIPHKDNFMWFPRRVLEVSWTRPISFEDEDNSNTDLTKEDHKKVNEAMNKEGTEAAEATDMLDHDPIVGVLVLSSPSKAVKNLSEEFKDMSLSGSSEGEKAHPATEKLTYSCFPL